MMSNTGNSDIKIPNFYMRQFKSKVDKQAFILKKMQKGLQQMKGVYDQNHRQNLQQSRQSDERLFSKHTATSNDMHDYYPQLVMKSKFKVLENKVKKQVVQNIIEDDLKIEKILVTQRQSKRSTIKTQQEMSMYRSIEKTSHRRYSTVFTNNSELCSV